MEYSHEIVLDQIVAQQDLLKEETLHSPDGKNHISDWPFQHFEDSILRSYMLCHKIDENEHVELLLQCLPNLYDQLIINPTNNQMDIPFEEFLQELSVK